ncbi:hypothetical protein QYF36_006805 [Acer negundo]|nr:hypothetical protein QYF36_006805 [Acer negundo]
MERLSVFGLLLAILSAITSKYASYGDTKFSNCSKNDLEALINFQNGLEDPENRLSSWKGSNCCQWRGIDCDNSTGAVVSIDLRNPFPVKSDSSNRYGFWNLSGEVRPALLKLKSLEYLDLSLNTFNDIPIPEFFGSMENLLYLNLSTSGFSGAVPSNLGNLSRLQYLDLSTEFSSLSCDSLEWVTGLVSLKHLAMNYVDLSLLGSDWISVLNMNLTELHLSSCLLTGSIPSTKPVNSTSFTVVDLSTNPLNSELPDWLVNISTLVHFDLSNCNLYGRIPLGFGELPNLQYFNLAENNNLSASCFQLFRGSWKMIRYINLASNKLHGKLPSSIGNMTFLTDFDLSINNVGGGIPNSIGKLCNLKEFDLFGNNLTGSLPEFLEGTDNCVSNSPLPNLMYLRLSNNHLQGKLPDWLGQLGNLVELVLSYNQFQGPIPASLGNLQNLTIMSLEGNEINGNLPESFGNLFELSTLDVSVNHLTGFISEVHFSRFSGDIPLWIGDGFADLRILKLRSNGFSGEIPPNLSDLSSLQVLDLAENNLTGRIPGSLGDLQAMAREQIVIQYLLYGKYRGLYYEENLIITTKNQLQPFTKTLSLVTSLDLSGNNLSGDFPQELTKLPSGRYSDGRLIIDFIADKLGLPYLNAYLDALLPNFRHGAGFAAAGATIQPVDAKIFGAGFNPLSLDIQLLQFEQLKERVNEFYNQAKSKQIKSTLPRPEDFSKALYTLDCGQNDLHFGLTSMSEEQTKASIPNIINHFATAVENLYQVKLRNTVLLILLVIAVSTLEIIRPDVGTQL